MATKPCSIDERMAERSVAVDALRGFDMFWIIGIEGSRGLVRALDQLSDASLVQQLARQMAHSAWAGFTFCDLIFPLFVFLAGLSIVFSLGRLSERSGKPAAYRRIARRFLVLYALGVFYHGGMANSWPNIRLVGVLQRIALCYLFAGLIFCRFRLKGMMVICIALLVAYWALMSFVPVPGVGAGCFEPGKNLANYLDDRYLPGARLCQGAGCSWDPEGLLSTIPAISTCLIGVFAGLLLRSPSVSPRRKTLYLMAAGVLGVVLGFAWGANFPVIKKIWTSSYVLVAGGYSCLLLGAFYLIVDVWRLQRWARPFVWIGMNPLILYLAYQIVDFPRLATRLVGGNISACLGAYGPLLTSLVALALMVALAWFLYRRRIFLRA